MKTDEQIRQALLAWAEKVGPIPTVLGVVVSVDEAAFTCVIDDGDIEIPAVRLRCVLNGKESHTIFPKVGSYVLAVRIEADAEWMVVAADEIDKYRIVVGDSVFEIKEGILIKNNDETLKKILTDLCNALLALTVNTGNGPSSTPINAATITAIKARIPNLLK